MVICDIVIIDMYRTSTRNKASYHWTHLRRLTVWITVNSNSNYLSAEAFVTVVRLLINMYTSQCLRVYWGDTIADGFTCLNGVKPGEVISPILSVYIWIMDVLLLNFPTLVLVVIF